MTRKELVLLTVRLALPAILAQVSSVVMQFADSAMVGRMGAVDSAAIGLIGSSSWLINSVTMSLGTGFMVQVAHRIGAQEARKARDVVKHGLLFSLAFCLLMTVFAEAIRDQLPVWLGGEPEVCVQSTRYWTVYMLGLPFMMLNYTACGMLQASGDIKVPSLMNIIMCGLNIVFNYFLIFPSRILAVGSAQVFLPRAGLGVVGAALGTILAETVVAIITLAFLLLKSPDLRLRRGEKTRFAPDIISRAFRIAIPVAVEGMGMAGAQVAFTKIAATLGTFSIAANSFTLSAESICFMPAYGVQVAATTLVGQSIGAARKDMARKLAWLSVGLGMAMIAATALFMFLAAPVMIGVLTPVAEIQVISIACLRIVAIAEPFYCANVVANGSFRGAGYTLIPSIMVLASMWLVRIPLAAYIAPRYGLPGMWGAMAFELIFRGTIFLLHLKGNRWLNRGTV